MHTRSTKFLLLGASPAMVLLAQALPAMAQSTGTQQVETVVVTGQQSGAGILSALEVPKERSVITKDFIETQPAGQTLFDTLNTVPGFNFTNTDPYGNSGGNIRLHGMDGNRISLTWDGMPLNDTGNYATFTNQIVDTEIVDRVSVNQGTTDVDSPTASSTGGVINILTTRPSQKFGVMTDLSVGSDNYQRGFFRVDSGAFGPWGTRAFATYSYTYYDKFKGPGNLLKAQVNADVYQDLGDLGWINLAAHFNRNRNDQYNNVSFLDVNSQQAYLSSIPNTTTPNPSPLPGILSGTGSAFIATASSTGSPNVARDGNGNYTGVIPPGNNIPIGGFGLGFDEDPTCTRPTPAAGTAQSDASISYLPGAPTSCTGFYRVRVNPSDTGNIRASSLWHIMPNLTFTLDTNFQYVLANGGGFTAVSETDAKLRGATTGTALTGAALTAARTAAPFGCIAGNGCDLNGDGDILDTVGEYTPNNTNTRRYGVNTQLIYALDEQNTFQFAYVLDWGLHRQTGQWSTFDNVNGPASFFGGLDDPTHQVKAADGFSLRQRDRKSVAILNQFSFDYEGSYFDGSLRLSAGVRLPYFERDLNQYCYNQTTGFGYCTTELPTSTTPAANGTFAFAGSTGVYTAPGTETVNYARTLPNAGVTWLPLGMEHQFFFTYAQGISVPRTDNLYNGGTNANPVCKTASPAPAPCVYTTFAQVNPETTATYDLGYRYSSDFFDGSVTAWNTQYRNRIVTTYDPDQGISIDHNIGTVNMDGVDFEGDFKPIENLDIYESVSYLHSRVAPGPLATIFLSATSSVSIANKQVLETPEWTESSRIQYKIDGLRIGVGGKFVGRRFATDNNDYKVPAYFTANADVTYDLGELGWDKSYLKFNVSNLFDEDYFGSVGTSKNCFTPTASTISGCTAYPLLSVGSPRTFQVELRVVY